MSYGYFSNNGKDIIFGFDGITDWFDSVIQSFPAPWIIGDDTNYGTEIFDSRAVKVLRVWMPWGNPSERQRHDMSDAEWVEYCCDSHWESETQWHIANAIVTTRNYLQAHKERGWYGDDDEQREILRNLIMAYGSWKQEVDTEITCGGPDRRMTRTEAAQYVPLVGLHITEWSEKEKREILEKLAHVKPAAGTNPDAAEAQNQRRAFIRAIDRMITEQPPTELLLPGGLKVDSFTMMDKPYLERLVEIAEEEYDQIKRATEPKIGKDETKHHDNITEAT
jgi:hypothetical protein